MKLSGRNRKLFRNRCNLECMNIEDTRARYSRKPGANHLNKFIFFIVPLLIISISCKSKRYKEIEYLLAGDEYKYWRLDSIDSPSEFCYYRNYTYDRFFFNQKLKTRHESGNPYGDDVLIGPNTWKIIDDSTLLFNGHITCRIIELSDSIFFIKI